MSVLYHACMSDAPAPSVSPDVRPPRFVPWAYWANRLELAPEELTPADLARAAWETATSTTQRHFAGTLAHALGRPIFRLKDTSPAALVRRAARAVRHPNRPSVGWDRIHWIFENHAVANPLSGFSGACLLAAIAAGAPDDVWEGLTREGWIGPNQHVLYVSTTDRYLSPKAIAVRAWQPVAERQRPLMDPKTRASHYPPRPYDIASTFDAVALWGPLKRIGALTANVHPSVRAHMYERAVFLNASDSSRLAPLRARWLELVAIEDEKIASLPTSTPKPWFASASFSHFLALDGAGVPSTMMDRAVPMVRHVLEMLVGLASARLGLTDWLVLAPTLPHAADPATPPSPHKLPPTLCHRGRTVLFQNATADLLIEPTVRALADPQGFSSALDEASRRVSRPPTDETDARPFDQLWATVCAHLCAPDDQAAAWAAYRAHDICELLGKEGARVSRDPARSLLYWGVALLGLANPAARVLLAPKIGEAAADLEEGLLEWWGCIIDQDVEALIAAGVSVSPLLRLPEVASPNAPSPPSSAAAKARQEHLLLSLVSASADIEGAFSADLPSPSKIPTSPARSSRRRL